MAYNNFAPPPPPPPPGGYHDQGYGGGPFADPGYSHHQQSGGYNDPYNYSNAYNDQPHSYPPPGPLPPAGGGGYHDAHTPGGASGYNDGYFGDSRTALATGPGLGEKDKEGPTTMRDEYADMADQGFSRSKQSRGSVAATLAAEGAIPRKAGLKMWRSDEHAGTYTRGGKGRCCGRCCLCTSCIIVLLIVGIVCAFLLWVRPPSVKFNGVQAPANGRTVQAQPNGFLLNFTLSLDVANPNFFGATFEKVTAKAFYPANDSQPIGGGELDDVHIQKNANTPLEFPFAINYTTTIDPGLTILRDIATKCGFIGSTKSKIKVNYDLTLKTKVALITISPTFSSSTEFECPLEQSDVQGLLGNILGGGLGGRSLHEEESTLAAREISDEMMILERRREKRGSGRGRRRGMERRLRRR